MNLLFIFLVISNIQPINKALYKNISNLSFHIFFVELMTTNITKFSSLDLEQ
jgi:hypothetical protein